MLVVVAGGTGFLGRFLVKALRSDGHRVVTVSRTAAAPDIVSWTQISQEGLPKGTEAVVQLAGQSVLKLPWWTEAHKKEVLDSRLHAIGVLTGAMLKAPPKVFLVASAVGYYPLNTPEALTEDAESADPSKEFLAKVCIEIERATDAAATAVERVVKLRIGVILGRSGGALQQMWTPFSLGLGGRLGSGKQPFPWIHMADAVGLCQHALSTPAIHGPLNLVAPGTCDNAAFTAALGKALGRPTILPVPEFVLRSTMGEESVMLLDGQRVSPAKALATGYVFKYPGIDAALSHLAASNEY